MKYPIEKVIEILKLEYKNWKTPVVTLIALNNNDPFKVLISTIISLRTKDEVTIEASKRIFKVLKSPKDINKLTIPEIEKLIYPAGFYKRKSIQIKDICQRLNKEFDSKVPSDLNTLLTFKGIGRKTANLILAEGFKIPAICVDVHVHRISNRIGYIKTKDPKETEFRLRKKLDKKYWIKYNTYLVAFGQALCKPINPRCDICPIKKYCKQIKVKSKYLEK